MSGPDLQDVDRLARRLREATDRLSADPGLAHRAAEGGGRRLNRRRKRAVGGAVLAVIVVTTVAVALATGSLDLRPDRHPEPAERRNSARSEPFGSYAELARRATRGELAGDAEYAAEVTTAWLDYLRPRPLPVSWFFGYDEASPVGTPHLVWAGRSPGGRAAMLVQQVNLRDSSEVMPNDDETFWVAGFVGVDAAGHPRVVGNWQEPDRSDAPSALAWYVDPGRTSIVVIDPGIEVRWTDGLSYRDDGSAQAEPARRVDFTDGAAVLEVEPGYGPHGVRVLTNQGSVLLPPADAVSAVAFAGPGFVTQPAQVPGLGSVRWQDVRSRAESIRSRAVAQGPEAPVVRPQDWRWLAAGRQADGTVVAAFVQQYGNDWPHVYLVTLGDDGDRLRHVQRAPDSVRDDLISVPLPDGSGTIEIYKRGRLRYQQADGSWSAWADGQIFKPDGAGLTETQWVDKKEPPD